MAKGIPQTTFMGRKSEIYNITHFFSSDTCSGKKIYSLFGESGIGKSYICKYIYDEDSLFKSHVKILIDFNFQTKRRMINLIESIVCIFSSSDFYKTNELLNKYYNSVDSSKPVFFQQLLDCFIKEINRIALATPILVILDTLEVIYNSFEWEYIKRFIFESSDQICFLCSGINVMESNNCFGSGELLGFNTPEIVDYFSRRIPKLRKELRRGSSFLPEKIRMFTKNGHPILCGLLADWLMESPSQLSYVLDNNRDISERLIISEWFKEATTLDSRTQLISKVLQLMAYFTKRMDSIILKSLLDIDDDTSEYLINKIGGYSFVKYYQEDQNIILHDIVAELIREHHPLSDICLFYGKLMVVYDQLISAGATDVSSTYTSYLRLENTYYHLAFDNKEDAIDYFEREFLLCLDGFDFSMCNVLLTMIQNNANLSIDEQWQFTSKLAEADLLLAYFRPKDSIELYTKLKASSCYDIPIYKSKADEIYARSIMNPCTSPQLRVNDAIMIFNQCIQVYNSEGKTYRLTRAWLYLGMAYVRIGRSNEAKTAYEEAEKHSSSNLQKISILLELSKMLRLQQFVEASLIPLTKCESLIGDIKANKGKYFYYFGNTMRDLNEFEAAEEKYKDALKELSAGVDDFILAELYIDYSWMEYLRSEHDNFNKVYELLEKGWDLVKAKGFGSEFSEYYHIKYEIERDQGIFNSAFENLELALTYAKEYSNIYMILDCLNHRVQQLYMNNDISKIPEIIKEMEDIEKTGCGIRVFRGRAKLVQGDVYYDQGDLKSAFREWKEGFCIVALYGNSRSNVELFSDLFSQASSRDNLSRKDKMKEIILRTSNPKKSQLKRYWSDKRVSAQFDYFIDELYN